jgi:hypothetical protein
MKHNEYTSDSLADEPWIEEAQRELAIHGGNPDAAVEALWDLGFAEPLARTAAAIVINREESASHPFLAPFANPYHRRSNERVTEQAVANAGTLLEVRDTITIGIADKLAGRPLGNYASSLFAFGLSTFEPTFSAYIDAVSGGTKR